MTSKAASIEVIVKVSKQQHRDYTACADLCGLSLEHWISQCADVKAAAVIDALQVARRADPSQPTQTIPLEPVSTPKIKVTRHEKRVAVAAAAAYNKRYQRPRKQPIPR